MVKTILASYYDDKIGYKGDDLYDGHYWYGELSKCLGGLPYRHKLKITYKGSSAIGMKGDEGKAAPNRPKLDIHHTFAKQIKFPSYSIAKVTIKNALKSNLA